MNQGSLGNCWFLCALAGLAESHPSLLERVVPRDQGFSEAEYAGIFHFLFWQYGQWVEVVVDDLLPTRDGRLMYVTSDDGGEMWPCLLEKAYAKLHGSYQHLERGWPVTAMVDLTGGFPEIYNTREYQPLSVLDGDLFVVMDEARRPPRSLVCTATMLTSYESLGILGQHAYTVMEVREAARGAQRLVRLRNPWGSWQEWRGAWSKGSMELAQLSASRRAEMATAEGEWWMAYSDFLRVFTSLSLCHPLTDGSIGVLQGEWDGTEIGLLDNPQYLVKVTTAGLLRAALSQRGRRQLRDELDTEDTDLPIRLILLKRRRRRPGDQRPSVSTPGQMVAESLGAAGRTVTLRAWVETGNYILLPSVQRGASVAYCLRLVVQGGAARVSQHK